MVGNLALKKGVAEIYTTVGAAAFGWDSLAGLYPADLLPVSVASAATITMPPARLTSTALGGGNGQVLGIMNLAAVAVTPAAASGDSILGSSATIAQNATALFVADATNNRWYRISG